MTHNTSKLNNVLLDHLITDAELTISIVRASPETPTFLSRPERKPSTADIGNYIKFD